MRVEMEQQLKADLTRRTSGMLSEAQLSAIRAEAQQQAQAEAARLEQERLRAEEEAARIREQQKTMEVRMEQRPHGYLAFNTPHPSPSNKLTMQISP